MRTTLRWTARTAGILAGLYGSLFALESFRGPGDFAHRLGSAAMNLIPIAVYSSILAVAWRREWVGAILFTLLAALYAGTWGYGRPDWTAFISGLLLLLAALFLAAWRSGRRSQDSTGVG